MLTNLGPIINRAKKLSTAAASVNVFGYEDALAVVEAAEAADCPVILAASRDLTSFMPVEAVASMLRHLAEKARVDVCVHLDHCNDGEMISRALDSGFTSVMFDGSAMPLAENIAATQKVVRLAGTYGATCEGEIGSVAYRTGRDYIQHQLTDPQEAARFFTETGVDVMAVSVGNMHRLESKTNSLDYSLFGAISSATDAPLCIHGVSGIPDDDIRWLATSTNTVKLNVATIFRMEWGNRLRSLMNEHPQEYDRIYFMKLLHPFLTSKISTFLELLTSKKS